MKRYANIAMIVGILLVVYSFLNFSLNQIWDWISTISLILGLAVGGMGVYYWQKFREKKISKRSLQYGANTALSVAVVFGILVLLSFITDQHHIRADLTAKGLYSLSEQTKSVLNDLNKEVKIWAFYKKSDEMRAQDLLEQYGYRSHFIKYEFVDPNQKPQLARQYGITQYNTVVVECGNKRETITDLNETNLTNAIIKVSRDLDKVVYFTVGHGERDIEDSGPRGYKIAADGIRKENYQVKTLNLAEKKSIPEDCSVLIIASPKSDFFSFELDTIKKYIDNGGKLMVLLDPEWKPALVKFLENYKIKVGDNVVVDASGLGQLFGMGPEVPLVGQYSNHPIFKDFKVMTFYPQACSVEATTKGETGVGSQVLFKTSPSSWAETDYRKSSVKFDPDKDLRGPVPLAAVATKTVQGNKKARILVIGDSDFAMNAYIRNSGNYDAFLNEVNWLAEEEDLITIRPKEIDDRRVNLTARDSKVVLYTSVFALPLLVVITGVVVYFRRR